MSEPDNCPRCGTELPVDAPAGLCPNCLVVAGLNSEESDDAELEKTASSSGSAGFVPPSVDELAKLFPQLEILEFIGKGGMGAVYRARQPALERMVAVKILPPEVGQDSNFSERFTREARAMARLSHPNIVAIHDFGQTDGIFYFVMEYIDGANLRQTMQAGKLTPEQALAIIPQVCDALQYAHEEGVVHRDIKPENILLDKKGRVKVADYGLSKLLGDDISDASLTGTHQVMGTWRYMAPEQMQGTRAVDHRADIFSLGVVFYEMLTGELPMGRFEPPSSKAAVDVGLDQVVLRALEQEPDKRYQRASQVKSDMEMLAGKPPLPQPPAPKPAKPVPIRGGTFDNEIEAAKQAVKIPAIGLMLVGILTGLTPLVLGTLVFFWLMVKENDTPATRVYPPVQIESDSGMNAPFDNRSLERLESPRDDTRFNSETDINSRIESNDSSSSTTPLPNQLNALQPMLLPTMPVEQFGVHSAAALSPIRGGQDNPPLQQVAAVRSLALGPFLLLAGVQILFSLVGGIVIAWGGWSMFHLRSHSLSTLAAILALLPCQPVALLGLVFGIWSLIVLSRAEVKQAFERVRDDWIGM